MAGNSRPIFLFSHFFRLLLIFFWFSLAFGLAFGQDLYESGLRAFLAGDYSRAQNLLDQHRDTSGQKQQEALFLLCKAALLSGDYGLTQFYINEFAANFGESPLYASVKYLQGRLNLIQKDYSAAALIFSDFLNNYHDAYYTPAAYYWLAVCLYSLEQYSDAEKILVFYKNNFSSHFLVNEADYLTFQINEKLRGPVEPLAR